jgi:hypothetical protein
MSKTITPVFASIAFFAACFTGIPSAQALTAQEALRLLGVLGRYADDINRTFPNSIGQPNNPFNPQIPSELLQQ